MRYIPIALLCGMVAVIGCGARRPRPVLYPNATLQQVGGEAADRDIDQCLQLADNYVQSGSPGAIVGTSAAVGAGAGGAIGAAGGAAGGAVLGHAGKGAAVGGAFGAGAGLMRGLFRGSARSALPSPVYRKFVNHCLRDRGYQPIGWQ